MKALIPFKIECGEKTCTSENGNECRYIGYTLTGKPGCYFFGDLEERDGGIQRHKECIKNAKTTVNDFWRSCIEVGNCIESKDRIDKITDNRISSIKQILFEIADEWCIDGILTTEHNKSLFKRFMLIVAQLQKGE
jgi:hypothetical protein